MSKENKKRNVDRKAERPPLVERVILFLEYLRKNTDENHKIASIGEIQEFFGKKGIDIGNDSTLNTLIKRVASAYNEDGDGWTRPQPEWRIVFDAYIKKYGGQPEEEFEEEEFEEKKSNVDAMRIRNLYYAHEFSNEDINALAEAVLFSRTIGEKDANRIINLLEDQFASKYYKKRPHGIRKIHEKNNYDKELLRKNLQIIQQAIENDMQIEYQFNGYTHDHKLKPMKNYKRTVSPYYIVADNGRYYLLAANEKYKNVMTIRVDLLTDVTIPKEHIHRIPIKEVSGMPQSWDDNFSYMHFQMAYDSPRIIKLRVKSQKTDLDKHIDPDYTFLHDNFGNTYEYQGMDEHDPNYDIVKVRCSPFGIVNLALQYADKVEILEPLEVREMVQEKVRILREKYQKTDSDAPV